MNRSKLTLLPVLAAIALAGCGGDAPSETAGETGTSGTGTSVAETAPGSEPSAGGESVGDGAAAGGDRAGGDPAADAPSPSGGAPSNGEGAGGACQYHAPPGRLAGSTISIELAGAPCEVARRLAKAAALGQPAGANIPVSAEGYRCEPSTRDRGVNVAYSCSKGSRGASFEIEWTPG